VSDSPLPDYADTLAQLREDFVRYANGDPKVPFAVVRDAVTAFLNAADELGPVSALACPRGHRYLAVSSTPLRDGRPRCPHCTAAEADLERGNVAVLSWVNSKLERGLDTIAARADWTAEAAREFAARLRETVTKPADRFPKT
jgi:hypothetical protein